MSARVRTTYVLLIGMWMILAGRIGPASLALGVVGIVIATVVFGQIFLPGGRNRSLADLLARAFALGCLVPIFLFEALRAATKLAFMAMQPQLRFEPGVIRVPTTLKSRSAMTLLANLITLSPGTLTLDFSFEERCYYIHCIDIRNLHGEAGRRALIAQFEEPLRRVFE